MSDKLTDRALHKIMVEQGHTPTFVPKKERKKRDDEESRNQRELIKWWHVACRGFGVPEILLFSIPNGGGRSGPIIGSILKAEGLRKGAPDLMLAKSKEVYEKHPERGHKIHAFTWNGLFIEMKTPTGHILPEQEVFHKLLREHGYQVEVCRGWQEARDVITKYLT